MLKLNDDELAQMNIWDNYAKCGLLQSTIDPRDAKGLKCDYIDKWSAYYLNKYITSLGCKCVLEVGCGGGRNLLRLAETVEHGYGIDIASEQIMNARERKLSRGIRNVDFFDEPEQFIPSCGREVDCLFTFWLLMHFKEDANLISSLNYYLSFAPNAKKAIFFEQVSLKPYVVEEGGRFYKRIRSKDEYVKIFNDAGLVVEEFAVLNEKGFGPFYRTLYLGALYRYWPKRLNINSFLLFLDRFFCEERNSRYFYRLCFCLSTIAGFFLMVFPVPVRLTYR